MKVWILTGLLDGAVSISSLHTSEEAAIGAFNEALEEWIEGEDYSAHPERVEVMRQDAATHLAFIKGGPDYCSGVLLTADGQNTLELWVRDL